MATLLSKILVTSFMVNFLEPEEPSIYSYGYAPRHTSENIIILEVASWQSFALLFFFHLNTIFTILQHLHISGNRYLHVVDYSLNTWIVSRG